MLQQNPVWIDRVLRSNWQKLVRVVSADALPHIDGRKFVPFGEGHYGAVYPTGIPSIACKVTSDQDEARFVTFAMRLAEREKYWPPGITQYVGVLGIADTVHRGRPVFVLWREEAKDYDGALLVSGGRPLDRHAQRTIYSAELNLTNYKQVAHKVRLLARERPAILEEAKRWERWAWDINGEILDGFSTGKFSHVHRLFLGTLRGWSGPQRVAFGLRRCMVLAEMMGSEPVLTHVGEAFEYYQDEGMLLADVHMANIGMAHRSGYNGPVDVIRDPGHALPLTEQARAARPRMLD